MNGIVERALDLWGLKGAPWSFVAKRENRIYRVRGDVGDLALRLHRRGYRTDSQLRSELLWLAAAARGGISVPDPVPAGDGEFFKVIEGIQVDVLRWLPGHDLLVAMDAPKDRRIQVIRQVARAAARLHMVCDAWTPPPDFDRPAWDIEGLTGEAPVWGRFWENPRLSRADARLLTSFRDEARTALRSIAPDLDYGLIHADLLRENVLLEGPKVTFIDFDDGGTGFRLFELATMLIRFLDAPDYADLRDAVFAAYAEVRPLDTDAFDLILALRATTYVGWIADRRDLADAAERQTRNLAVARDLIRAYRASR